VLTVPTQNEINGILAVDVQDPFKPGTYYKAGTSILTSPDISPIAKQELGFWGELPPQWPSRGRLFFSSTRVQALQPTIAQPMRLAPSKRGQRRFEIRLPAEPKQLMVLAHQRSQGRTGINYPTLPFAAGMARPNGRIKILDQQVALGYTHVMGTNKVLEARLGLSGTRAGKYTLSIGDNAIVIPGLPD